MAVPVCLYLLVGQLSNSSASLDEKAPSSREVAVLSAGFGGRCPRCNKGKLFCGLLRVCDTCAVCGFNLSRHEKGDGPAFFAITIVSTLVCLFAVIVELLYQPPYWLHALLWVPFVVIGSLLCLRWAKGIIIAIQYKHRVDEFADDDT